MITPRYKPGFAISSMSLKDGCWYCGQPWDRLKESMHAATVNGITWDHIIPRHLGGQDTYDNLIPACFQCNSHKKTRSLQQYRDALKAAGLPCEFDDPHPYALIGTLIEHANGETAFISDDGTLRLTDPADIFQRRTNQFYRGNRNLKWITGEYPNG